MGRIAIGVAVVFVLFITERLVVALYLWNQQERGRIYANGWIWGWRGFTKINPDGTTEFNPDPFVLLLRFNVPRGAEYIPRAPKGWLSEYSRLSTASGWEAFRRVGPPERNAAYDVYLVTVRTTPRLLLGNWGIQNAVWLEPRRPDQAEKTGSEEKLMKPAYLGREFEALRVRYEDQVELLRTLTKLDLQIFTGYLTLQAALGGWFATQPIGQWQTKFGILLVDFALTFIAAGLLYNNYRRRAEVVETIRNLCDAFGFTVEGVYLPGRAINPPTTFRPWWYWFLTGIGIALIGVTIIIVWGVS